MIRILVRSGIVNWLKAFFTISSVFSHFSPGVDNQFHAIVYKRICVNNKVGINLNKKV